MAWCGEVGAESAGARGFYDEAMRCRETWKEESSCSVALPRGQGQGNSSNAAGRMPIDDGTLRHNITGFGGACVLFLTLCRLISQIKIYFNIKGCLNALDLIVSY